jgi:nitrate reductase NapE component
MNSATVANDIMKEDKPGIAARIFGNFFSYLFHPVFVPLYIIFFLLYIHPSAFSGFSEQEKKQTVLIILLNLVLFPLITVLLLKAVGFIDSLYLRTQKDRIIPYIASGIFFFWGYTVFKEQPQYPPVLTAFILGIFLASSAALLANIYFKVSMHAIGMGGWLGFFLLLFYRNSMLMTWPLCLALLITGLVCSSRLLLRSHEQKDIYGGLLIGMVTQWIAAVVVL